MWKAREISTVKNWTIFRSNVKLILIYGHEIWKVTGVPAMRSKVVHLPHLGILTFSNLLN